MSEARGKKGGRRPKTKAKAKPRTEPSEETTKAALEVEREEEKSRLLKLREELKRRRPKFVRQESWRYKRVKESWRRPKGIDSKMRLERKGWPKRVKIGYRGPALVRGLHPTGKREILVHNEEELRRINPNEEVARLSATLGKRSRLKLLQLAKGLGIRVLNPGVALRAKEG